MKDQTPTPTGYYEQGDCDIAAFEQLISQSQSADMVPHAVQIEKNIPIYNCAGLGAVLEDSETRRTLMAEWAAVLHRGAGVFVLKQAQPNHAAIDAATKEYTQIIDEEKAAGGTGADHFATAGANDRIWNSLQKLCDAAPEVFAAYHASVAIDAASEAWLGPNYQMTAQVNLVRPGGQSQQAHRDYHLGFQTEETSGTYPAHVHALSPVLTLQGGIAHCDMSVESGPTKLLPFSQAYGAGYAAWRREDFRALFEERYVQLPLDKGDAIFFSPALFHAAGENRSKTVERFVNLLQVSSAFGRAMETIDRARMCKELYPVLQAADWPQAQIDAVIAASAEGYSFPTNLDRDPPVGGLAPMTQAGLMRACLDQNATLDGFCRQLDAQEARRLS